MTGTIQTRTITWPLMHNAVIQPQQWQNCITLLPSFVMSANFAAFERRMLSKLFTYITKRGSQDRPLRHTTSYVLPNDTSLFKTKCYWRSWSQCPIHAHRCSSIPCDHNLDNSLLWGTLSNASFFVLNLSQSHTTPWYLTSNIIKEINRLQ